MGDNSVVLRSLISNRHASEYGKVAVLLGGCSAEREVSLCSGEAIHRALLAEGIDAVKIDPKYDVVKAFQKNAIDRALIALHGREGEDGVVQGLLRSLKIPFTGSDVASAAISMNKALSKQIWQQMKIPTASFSVVERADSLDDNFVSRIFIELGPTLFVKPIKEGSSMGMSRVTDVKSLRDALKLAHQYDHQALVESFVAGKEYTVSIIKGVALPSISMQTPREFYDYQAKYESDETQYFCPSDLTGTEEVFLGELALKAFRALGCSGWGRVDFIRDGIDGKFLILEANTVPGMTESSLFPKAAAAAGINFKQLVKMILDTSF